MDARQLAVFTADVRSQMQSIQRVAGVLTQRAEGLQLNLVLPLLQQDVEQFLQALQPGSA